MNFASCNWFLIAFTLGLFYILIFCVGLFYERYEILLSALASNQLTPEIQYDDFFHLGHIFIIEVYSVFYHRFTQINWLTIIQLFYLAVAFGLILRVFQKQEADSKLKLLQYFLLAVLFSEHVINLVHTRVSFVLSFAALLALCAEEFNNTRTWKKQIIYVGIFAIAAMTRPESAALMLILVAGFHFLLVGKRNISFRFWRDVRLFSPMAVVPLFIFLWIHFEIEASNEFYKQIEPEVEYELTARNNIVPIGMMKTARDSMRYLAIDQVMWGDASTNDAEFLRSLIGDPTGAVDYNSLVLGSAYTQLYGALMANRNMVLLTIVLFGFILFGQIKGTDSATALLTMAYGIFLFTLLFWISYRIKITIPAISCIFFSTVVLLLAFCISGKNNGGVRREYAFLIASFFCIFQVVGLKDEVEKLSFKTELLQSSWSRLTSHFPQHNLLLNGESKHILGAFSPLEPFRFDAFNKVVIYDSQHISTVEPYRSYLAKDCGCDPNDYASYFTSLIKEGDRNIFVMSKDFKIFLEEYLLIVHKLDIEFNLAINTPIMAKQEHLTDKQIWAYRINPKSSTN